MLTAISVQKHIDQQFFSIKHHFQIKVNFATSFFSDPASFSSRSLISAALSAEADVLSTTEEIIFILSETPVMQAACSSEDAEISAMFLSTSAVFFSTVPKEAFTVSASFIPLLIAPTVRSIKHSSA